ncbi:PREDICTED: dihydroflavonol 4-reductase-like isoform X2 [Nicotiana attenuata]|uniref:dihydroflavonol 4-reductase-like isoform X2 n=1 Tax=Nicotiana attenuata TaxID=49451 RepID=UPI0009051094|nr:PREDICTED: dihydroflavonol 4-reductase-like isoform X2 [Nicotiana attenuata]
MATIHAPKSSPGPTVCVTGAAGFIGSWLVMKLLQRGYNVHATVRDPENKNKVKHLWELPKADSKLTLWKAELTEEGSFDEAIHGCQGVFHVATPMDFDSKDPEMYFASKILAEKAAWEATKAKNIEFISIIPTLVVGPFITPTFPPSLITALSLITGNEAHYSIIKQGKYVHLDDLCEAHIFLYEHPNAQGRFLCSSDHAIIYDVAKMVREKWPEYYVPSEFKDIDKDLPVASFSSKKLTDMGFEFKYNLEDMYRGAIETCRLKGLLPYSTQSPASKTAADSGF